MNKYEHHYVNNPEGYNESVFDICDAVDDLIEAVRDPQADAYELGENAGWIVQNYCDMKKERDELRKKVKELEAQVQSKNPPIWSGWNF